MTTYLPKADDHLVVFGIPAVVSVLLPVIDIDVRNTTYQQFQLPFIKNVNELWRYQLVETRKEGIELFFDPLLDTPFGDEAAVVSVSVSSAEASWNLLDVFFFILICHLDLLTARFQFDADGFTKSLIIRRERELQCVSNIIISSVVC